MFCASFLFYYWGDVLLNGEEVLCVDRKGAINSSSQLFYAKLPLRKGENTLLIKAIPGSASWTFRAEINDGSQSKLYSGNLDKGDKPYYHERW